MGGGDQEDLRGDTTNRDMGGYSTCSQTRLLWRKAEKLACSAGGGGPDRGEMAEEEN